MDDWVLERLKAVGNRAAENAIWIVLIAGAFAVWRWASGEVTLPVWLLTLFVGGPLALAVVTRRRGRQPTAEAAARIAELEWENALYGYYAKMLDDVLRTTQQMVRGDLEGVSMDTFVEQGILEAARQFLRQAPGEDVRLSVVVPDAEGILRMKWMAGHRLTSKHAFSLPVAGSFSQLALQSGRIEWSFDVNSDHRFQPHPRAERPYASIISVPLRAGDDVVAVLNVVSTYPFAFTAADFVFIGLIGAVIDVVWSMAAGGDAPAIEARANHRELTEGSTRRPRPTDDRNRG